MNFLKSGFVSFFTYFHSGIATVFPNPNVSYGVAIIVFTLIVRIILLPLNIKQLRSQVRMQELQPEIKKIQDKYKKDPQKAQSEVMALYKEKGTSPFGGCLPLLIQWPILIALYWVFYSLTGINGVHFLWIKDLAKKDILLALISGGTTYLSTAIMGTNTGDGAQAKQMTTMNLVMTVFITYMSLTLKAALVLYWVTNNFIQIGQTWAIKKIDKKSIN